MLALKYLLMILGAGLFGSASALVAYDIFLSEQLRRLLSRGETDESGAEVRALTRRPFRRMRWGLALQLTAAGVRVSELWGARPVTLYPGAHLSTPKVDSITIHDAREQIYSTLRAEIPRQKDDVLAVEAREGVNK
jgi:hypothetical protein